MRSTDLISYLSKLGWSRSSKSIFALVIIRKGHSVRILALLLCQTSRATDKLEKRKSFSKVHDPQHPTIHLNLYLLYSFAALICTYSAFRLPSVFVAKRQSPASAEKATCCLPPRSAFENPPLPPFQLVHTRGPNTSSTQRLLKTSGTFT